MLERRKSRGENDGPISLIESLAQRHGHYYYVTDFFYNITNRRGNYHMSRLGGRVVISSLTRANKYCKVASSTPGPDSWTKISDPSGVKLSLAQFGVPKKTYIGHKQKKITCNRKKQLELEELTGSGDDPCKTQATQVSGRSWKTRRLLVSLGDARKTKVKGNP